jgi:hypothetical protein
VESIVLEYERRNEMKRIVQSEDGGFEAMLGEDIFLLCSTYFYVGKLVGVNEDHLELEEAKLVYETGPWGSAEWEDAQLLPGEVWRVMIDSVESWGKVKC